MLFFCFLVGLKELSCGFCLLGPKYFLQSRNGRLQIKFVASLLLVDALLVELSTYSIVFLSLLIPSFGIKFPFSKKERRVALDLLVVGKGMR